MRFGKTLLIQEMDGIDPVLYPILRGDLISQGSDLLILFIKTIEVIYHSNLFLFIQQVHGL